MLAVARCLLLALNFLLLSSPAFFQRSLGDGAHPFLIATILVTVLNVTLVVCWDRVAPQAGTDRARFEKIPALVFGLAGAIVVFVAAHDWLREILIYPHDSARADMLVVIQLGIRRLLQGHDPYTMYHVPWNLALPYGPGMWAPLIVPYLLHADVRFATLLGFLFVPVACAVVCVGEAARGRQVLALAVGIMTCAVVFSSELRHFVSIGHTAAYWPLLLLLAGLVTRERWYGAAIMAGLLVVARTTMVSVCPVLLIAIWCRERPAFGGALMLMAACAVVPFLPFAVWDWPMLKYSLYESYGIIVKNFVWPSTDWVEHTIGVTGLLVSRGWKGAVEIVQVVVMLSTYAASAVAIRAGARPLPWMALALLAFSMTALWPVIYLYFDVCLLFICAALSEMPSMRTRSLTAGWTTAFGCVLLVLAITSWAVVPVNASIDVGTAPDRAYLYSGFADDERDGEITFAWIEGTRATILVPRRSRRNATIVLRCAPHLPTSDTMQQLSASLNGTIIGTASLHAGWQVVEFAAPSRAWQIGVNELTLSLSTAVSPKEAGLSADTRKLSLAVNRLNVRTP